jgi:hypothetical protein
MAFYFKKIINGKIRFFLLHLLNDLLLKYKLTLDSLLLDYDEKRYPTVSQLKNKIVLRVKIKNNCRNGKLTNANY